MKKFISSTLAAITLFTCALPGVKAETMQEHISFIMDSITKNEYNHKIDSLLSTGQFLNNNLYMMCFANRSKGCLEELNELFEAELKGTYDETYKEMIRRTKNKREKLALKEFDSFLGNVPNIINEEAELFSQTQRDMIEIVSKIPFNARKSMFRIVTFLAFADLLKEYQMLSRKYHVASKKFNIGIRNCLYRNNFFIRPWMGEASYGRLHVFNYYRMLLYLISPEFARVKGIEPLNMESIKKLPEIGEYSKTVTPPRYLPEIKGKCTLSAFKNLIIQEYTNECSDEELIMDEHLLMQVSDQLRKLEGVSQTSDKRLMPYINLA